MDKQEMETRCYGKAKELLDKYFPNFIEDAAVNKPEVLADGYDDSLPGRVAEEYRSWLAGVWEEIRPQVQKPFDEIMNQKLSVEMTDASYVPYLADAREKAETVTLWEKLTKTNHQDVILYKVILKDYTEELLRVMTAYFLADIP